MNETIIIEAPRAPLAKNALVKVTKNGFAYQRYRELWQQELTACATPQQRRILRARAELKEKARLKITIYPKRLWPDRMNIFQALVPVVDACVNVVYLADDDDRHLALEVAQEKRKGRPLTVLEFSVDRQ